MCLNTLSVTFTWVCDSNLLSVPSWRTGPSRSASSWQGCPGTKCSFITNCNHQLKTQETGLFKRYPLLTKSLTYRDDILLLLLSYISDKSLGAFFVCKSILIFIRFSFLKQAIFVRFQKTQTPGGF